MGIIINQSFKNMVTTYFGFGIGAINTLFLFTYFLEKEYYGLVSFFAFRGAFEGGIIENI